jgi:ParB-like chromosome segregation protein Spo0J
MNKNEIKLTSNHYNFPPDSETFIVSISDIHEPVRDEGTLTYRSNEIYEAIKNAMLSGQELPPIDIRSKEKTNTDKYVVFDGFHRFHISKELGLTEIPVRIEDWDMQEFLNR